MIKMMERPSRSKNTLIKVIIIVAVVAVILFFVLTSVVLSLVLNQQFYENRLGLNWWKYFSMDNAAILWVPLITIMIGAIGVSLLNPVTSSTLNLIYRILKGGRSPSRRNCLIWNYLVIAGIGGLVAGWFIGFYFNVGFGIFVANHINLSIEFFPTFLAALRYPLNPGVMDINVLFLYTFIFRPFILLVVVGIIAKLVLDLINSISFSVGSFAFRPVRGSNPLKVAGTIALIISMVFFIGWLYLPSGAYDVVNSAFALSVVVGFFACLMIGLVFYIAGVVNPVKYREYRFYKPFIALVVIMMIVIPVIFVAAAGIKNLNYEANWNEWAWDTKLTSQITQTRTAAGITGFSELTTHQLIVNQSLSGTTDEEIIPHVRTYDYEASRASMENKIGTSWEELADSDIIYINNSEYWIAPRKIRTRDDLGMSWVQEHIIYTHSRGFIAINPVTGNLLPENSYNTIFGVAYNSSIYFGELPDNSYTLLNVTQYEEIENITYSGMADVTLSGFLNWWYIDDWGFKTVEPTNYLIKRNIYDRVGGILLPYMEIGDDPYLVFEGANNKMYYCVDIILQFPSFSGYLQSDIVRWLGVVLVDTQLGTMNFYQYNDTFDNLPYEFLRIYTDLYDWQPMPSWLIEQLKYPEQLIEYQLEADYTYHVTDPATWKSGEDFFVRPEETDLHYIMYDIGYGLEYVGASTVEFLGAAVGNLVGFYIVENGQFPNRLGTTTFYRNGTVGETQMIGLIAAKSAYQQEDAQFLKWLQTKRFGNVLIYPLGGSIYYVIPVYEISGANIQTLKRVALVNAFDPKIIGIGNSTIEAYNTLNVTPEIPAGVLSLSVEKAPTIAQEGQWKDLELFINNGYPDKSFNVSLYITVQTTLFNVSFGGDDIIPIPSGEFYNYSIANLTLLPTQYTGLIPQIRGFVPVGFVDGTIKYNVELYNGSSLFQTIERTLYVY